MPEAVQMLRNTPSAASAAEKAINTIERLLGSLSPSEQAALTLALDTLVVLGAGRPYPHGEYGDEDA